MPLTGTGALLGAAIAAAVGMDPIGALLAGGLGSAIATWVPGNVITLPGTMVAAGAAVSGFGIMHATGEATAFGALLAQSVGATDAPSIAKWTRIAEALISHLETFGRVLPVAFVAVPLGGPVTGAGSVGFASMPFVPPLSTALELSDAVNVALWAALGAQILSHIVANATALSLGFTSPPGGGALVGASTIL